MTIPQAFELAFQHHSAGRTADAEALYRQILAIDPNHAGALHHLGIIAQQAGRHDLAVDYIRRAMVLDPYNPAAYSNLGEAYRNLGQLDEALDAYRRALEIKPDLPEAYNNLGATLTELGRMEEAMTAYSDALRVRPDFAAAHYGLGVALAGLGQLDEAMAAYRRALELRPGYLNARNNLAAALTGQGRVREAIAEYRRALELNPGHAWVHSNLAYTLHLLPSDMHGDASEERRRWNRQFCIPLKQSILPHRNNHDPERRLRIGYVSPDFWDHVVGRNLLPLFRRHDRSHFEILCYSGVVRPDKMTDEFRRHSTVWRDALRVGDEALADLVRQDHVDILVDLTQHMAGNRLPMFARKPAPVQASFAGYPESTGLETIEYRISDRYLEAGAVDEGAGSREEVCLIDSFWCYDPCGVDVEVNGLPAGGSGSVTFGCLNNPCKVNEPALRLWARVLAKARDSRLVLLAGVGSQRQRTLDILGREGVEARRVEFVEFRPRQEYLELYHRVDIVLDTFPYNGHTTSLDALWMGVPVVSLAGKTPVWRAGLSQLTNLGLPELIAYSEGDYARIAVELAGALPRLANLRATLRPRMQTSPLMDASRFTRQVEQAYRKMWQAWGREQWPPRE